MYISEKRLCKYLAISCVLSGLVYDSKDHHCKRIAQHFSSFFRKLTPQEKASKVMNRLERFRFSIISDVSYKGEYSGYKVLLCLHHLAQIIFDEEPANDKNFRIYKSIKLILDYCATLEYKDRYKRLDSENDFKKLYDSSKKQAQKIYNKFFKEI